MYKNNTDSLRREENTTEFNNNNDTDNFCQVSKVSNQSQSIILDLLISSTGSTVKSGFVFTEAKAESLWILSKLIDKLSESFLNSPAKHLCYK